VKPATSPKPLFTAATIRALLTHVLDVLAQPEKNTLGHWNAYTLGRFAAWAAAVEGAVELIPEVVQFASFVVRSDSSDTFADYQGPLDALEKTIKDEDPPDVLFAHGSARVRHMLAEREEHSTRLQNDPDPVVRAQARHRYSEESPTQPWWVGVLPARPPDQKEVLKFGTLVEHMRNPNDWSHARELVEAFNALPRDLSGRIARRFLTPLWGGSTWAQPVWNALLQAPGPLAERRRLAEEAVGDLLLPSGFPREHHAALERAIDGCPHEEQRELASLLTLPRARLERPPDRDEHALWATRPRRRPLASRARRAPRATAAKPRAPRCPPGLVERLAHELVYPGPWGEDRFALHPRARWELGRGLRALDLQAAVLQNREATQLDLADLVALTREERPHLFDATQLALTGLLRALEVSDPIFAKLSSDSAPMLREAAALGLVGTDTPLARELLADVVPEVWTAARIAAPDAEPWRGPLVEDPFAGCSTEQAEALVPRLAELAAALPRGRYQAWEESDFMRLGRIAAALPAPHGLAVALRLLPQRDLHKRLAPLVVAILGAEGGYPAWVAEIEKRLTGARSQALWLGTSLVRFAVEAAFPADGGEPMPWDPERRWAAARDALARHARTLAQDKEVAEMWLTTAASLWPDDRDPLPLPGPWSQSFPDHWVSERLAQMSFGPDWPVTRAIVEGARRGFPTPWAWWHSLSRVIARLPEGARIEVALEGFWRDGEFGQWARKTLGEHLSRARAEDPSALHALLADTRLAPARLLRQGRTKQTLFLRRMRLAAGVADFAEGLSTLTAVATEEEVEPWTADEIQGWRACWMDAIRQAMAAGPGGPRGVFVTLAPPGLWEEIDRAFVRSVAYDATPEEAQAVARRLADCGDAEDLPTARELSEAHPAVAPWPELLETLAGRRVRDEPPHHG
jgi:hypothetical protein